MTRDKFLAAISVGMQQAKLAGSQKQMETLANALEMAFALDARATAAVPTPAAIVQPAEPDNPYAGMESPMGESPVIIETEPVQPQQPLVVAATEIPKNIAVFKPRSTGATQLNFGRPKRQQYISLDDAFAWCQNNFPPQIQIMPNGRKDLITLNRYVSKNILQGEEAGREKDSSIALTYKAETADSAGEVREFFRVGDMQGRVPDVDVVMGKIAELAKGVYAKRPSYIEGRAPQTEDLGTQLAMLNRQQGNRGKVADATSESVQGVSSGAVSDAIIEQIRKKGFSIPGA